MFTVTLSAVAEYYSKTQIETASKGKALCMLHERCIFFLAKTKMLGSEKPVLIIKAQNILSQLQNLLRMHDSISQSLFYLYDYCYICLERGNDQDIANTIEILGVLQKTFRELIKRS
jgi:flagellar biosynthetic protein FliS